MKKVKKKRGRKPKQKNLVKNDDAPVRKKRGRKPKGGKILKNEQVNNIIKIDSKPNIILHLKCCTKDLKRSTSFFSSLNYDPEISQVESFSIDDKNMYELYTYNSQQKVSENIVKNNTSIGEKDTVVEKNNFRKIIAEKLKKLQKKLHRNNIEDKKSNCFWCTFPFDNPCIYIPSKKNKDNIEVYGCFCSPECAVGYLNREKIDSSTLWERYSLLNNMYGRVFNYENNIKPAPDPYYTLEKYYGNLSIQEYRQLFNNNFILLVVDKPLTRIFPELHEESHDIQINYGSLHKERVDNNKTPAFSLKRNKKAISKKNILTQKFNF